MSAAAAVRAWARPVLLLVVSLACGWIIVGLVGRIDWRAVWDALGRLSLWQVPLLIAVLLVRQVFNALPLSLFIRGLSPVRALLNDQTAALLSMIAPPPSDLVMRLTMFRSWGIEPSRGLAGATMNTVSFYVNRFAAPIIGLALSSVFELETDRAWAAFAASLVAVLLAGTAYAVIRTEGFATRFGLAAGRMARRFRRSVDPQAWADSAREFQAHIAQTYAYGFWRAHIALVLMVVADSLILLMALRFVQVGAEDVPGIYVVAVFFLAYPLTLFPLMGLGIMDSVLLAAFVRVGGDGIEAQAIAALAVWRVVTLITPALLGIGAVLWWRRTGRARP
jgi:hypothetical protein